MKKAIYYFTPFMIYPVLISVLAYVFDKAPYSLWIPILFILLVTLASTIISLFSKSNKRTDILIAFCNLVAFLATMIVVVLIEAQLDEHYQFRIKPFFQPAYMLCYLLIFISGLTASHKRFRLKTGK